MSNPDMNFIDFIKSFDLPEDLIPNFLKKLIKIDGFNLKLLKNNILKMKFMIQFETEVKFMNNYNFKFLILKI